MTTQYKSVAQAIGASRLALFAAIDILSEQDKFPPQMMWEALDLLWALHNDKTLCTEMTSEEHNQPPFPALREVAAVYRVPTKSLVMWLNAMSRVAGIRPAKDQQKDSE